MIVLNVYQTKKRENYVFMFPIKSNFSQVLFPVTIFLNKIKKPIHNYPANFSAAFYSIVPLTSIKTKTKKKSTCTCI